MFKVSWARRSDKFAVTFVLLPDVRALFDFYHILTGYGRDDGCSPIDIKVTNLDGDEIDMSKGLADVAGWGTYGRR
jgi:hypothetical protein